jgi:hypothetical protein
VWLTGIFFPVLVCCGKKNLAAVIRPMQNRTRALKTFYVGHHFQNEPIM